MKTLRTIMSLILITITAIITINSILYTQYNIGYNLSPANYILWGSLILLAVNLWDFFQTQRYKSQILVVLLFNWSFFNDIIYKNRDIIENEILFYIMNMLILAMIPLAMIAQDSQDKDEKVVKE